MPPLLSVSAITKRFDNGVHALGPVTFNVQQGEFLSILGPSGCGKSTILRIIAGLLRADSGALRWAGDRPAIGFVFQEPTLMPWATALANVRLPLDLEGPPRHESDSRARQSLARVGLKGFESAYPRELSGGMKMRVSIARAIASRPGILLMDEPFAALDELTRQSLNDELLKLWREDNLTVVFVTHSVFESTYLSSRVLVLKPRPGQVAADITLAPPLVHNADYRLTAQFSALAGEVSGALRQAVEGAA